MDKLCTEILYLYIHQVHLGIGFLYKIFGLSYWPTYLWMFFVNIISSICIYKITIELGISKHLRLLGAFGFGLLGPYSFFSQIWYDSDTIFL